MLYYDTIVEFSFLMDLQIFATQPGKCSMSEDTRNFLLLQCYLLEQDLGCIMFDGAIRDITENTPGGRCWQSRRVFSDRVQRLL